MAEIEDCICDGSSCEILSVFEGCIIAFCLQSPLNISNDGLVGVRYVKN